MTPLKTLNPSFINRLLRKKLILVGSRTNLSDIESAARVCGYKIVGILDKHYWGNTKEISGIPVIGSEEELLDPKCKWRKYNFFPANFWDGKQRIGNETFDGDQLRQERINLLDRSGVRVINLIMDPYVAWVHFQKNLKLGKGILILAGSRIGANVSIGDYCILDWGSKVFNSTIGRNSSVGAEATISHVEAGDNVRIGMNSMLVPARNNRILTVGHNAVVYITSVVLDSIPEDHVYTMHGKMRKRFRKTVE